MTSSGCGGAKRWHLAGPCSPICLPVPQAAWGSAASIPPGSCGLVKACLSDPLKGAQLPVCLLHALMPSHLAI